MSAPTRATIAVVDDDPRILEALQELLESAGYEVQCHSSGSSLLANDISDIDCVITDVGMPVMDGFELREAVKRMRPSLQVFLISGRRDLSHERHADLLSENAFFRKPFDGQALLAAIEDALSRIQRP
jgi:FixJ family two-component response regulator